MGHQGGLLKCNRGGNEDERKGGEVAEVSEKFLPFDIEWMGTRVAEEQLRIGQLNSIV